MKGRDRTAARGPHATRVLPAPAPATDTVSQPQNSTVPSGDATVPESFVAPGVTVVVVPEAKLVILKVSDAGTWPPTTERVAGPPAIEFDRLNVSVPRPEFTTKAVVLPAPVVTLTGRASSRSPSSSSPYDPDRIVTRGAVDCHRVLNARGTGDGERAPGGGGHIQRRARPFSETLAVLVPVGVTTKLSGVPVVPVTVTGCPPSLRLRAEVPVTVTVPRPPPVTVAVGTA